MAQFKHFNTNNVNLEKGWKIHLSPHLRDINKVEKKFSNWANKLSKPLPYKIMNKEL